MTIDYTSLLIGGVAGYILANEMSKKPRTDNRGNRRRIYKRRKSYKMLKP